MLEAIPQVRYGFLWRSLVLKISTNLRYEMNTYLTLSRSASLHFAFHPAQYASPVLNLTYAHFANIRASVAPETHTGESAALKLLGGMTIMGHMSVWTIYSGTFSTPYLSRPTSASRGEEISVSVSKFPYRVEVLACMMFLPLHC